MVNSSCQQSKYSETIPSFCKFKEKGIRWSTRPSVNEVRVLKSLKRFRTEYVCTKKCMAFDFHKCVPYTKPVLQACSWALDIFNSFPTRSASQKKKKKKGCGDILQPTDIYF